MDLNMKEINASIDKFISEERQEAKERVDKLIAEAREEFIDKFASEGRREANIKLYEDNLRWKNDYAPAVLNLDPYSDRAMIMSRDGFPPLIHYTHGTKCWWKEKRQ